MNGPSDRATLERRPKKKRERARRRWPDRYRIVEDRRPVFVRANDLKMRRDVVIRIRSRDAAKGELRREIWVLERAARSNPNVPRAFDHWIDDDNEHLVLEYVAGTVLDACLQEGRAKGKPYFAPEQAYRMVLGLIKGLFTLHRNGICHGDLKPQNLVVARNKLVMIDFGSAWSGGSRPGSRDRGTPGYAAPEQWKEERLVDGRADQFSVSAILYEMLTNELPWDGLGGSVVQFMSGSIPAVTPPSDHPTNARRKNFFWPGLDEVVTRGLSIAKDDRFATTGAWLKAFERARSDRDQGPGEIRPPTIREVLSRLLSRFRSK